MASIMVTVTYPLHRTDEGLKLFMEKKLPEVADFVKLINTWVPVMNRQPKSYRVYEVPKDKIFDAMISISARYNGYRTVEGLEYTIELLATLEEAIATLK